MAMTGSINLAAGRYIPSSGNLSVVGKKEAIHDPANKMFYLIFDVGETLSDYGTKGTWNFWLFFRTYRW